MGRPNILWIQTEAQRPDTLGCYGVAWARTPNLDALAARGVVCRNAFCQAPLSVPSHSSQLTVRYPQEINTLYDNVALRDGIFPSGVLTFPEVFRDAGYHTANLGSFCAPNHQAWERHEPLKAEAEQHAARQIAAARNVIQRPGAQSVILGGSYPALLGHPARVLTDQAVDFLRERHDQRPLLLRVGYSGPQAPVLPPPPFDRGVTLAELPVEAPDQAAYAGRAAYDRGIADAHPMRELTAAQIQQAALDYLNLCAYLDYELGRLLAAVRAHFAEEDTIVVFSAGYGRLLGEWGSGESSTFDDQVWRVPLLWSWPGHLPAGQTRDDLCELLDTGPTLLALAGLAGQQPVEFRGRNIFAEPPPDTVYGQIGWPNWNAPLAELHSALKDPEEAARMKLYAGALRIGMRTDHYRLDVNWVREGRPVPRGELDGNLFDLSADPRERHNLWNAPLSVPVIQELLARLEAWYATLDRPEETFGLRDSWTGPDFQMTTDD